MLVTQTVILAAGLGSRLGSAEAGVPKPLVIVGGVPLIAHALEHARASGCREAIVVVGYEGSRVRAAVEAMGPALAVRFVETSDATAPNGHSLLAAEPLAGPQFFLQMVDHLFAAAVLPTLVAGRPGDGEAGRLLVDRSPVGIDLSDATKVRLDGRRVLAIGKAVEPWDAIDTGCFALTRAVFGALGDVPASEPRTVSAAMRRLAARGALSSAEIGGVPWVDIDTPADRADAERFLTSWTDVAPAGGGAPRR